jgi:hypothetical protein
MRGSKAFSAIACFSVALAAASCARRAPVPIALDAGAASAPAAPDAGDAAGAASAEAGDDGGGRAVTVADPYLEGSPIAAKSIGHTSYVLKVRLDNGLVAAFKPRSKLPLGDRRYKGEIAAYRLGRALGLDNVPIAMPRAFVAAQLRHTFPTTEGAEDFDHRALVDGRGMLRGALMPWIERYDPMAIEEGDERRRWERWLTDASVEVPDGDRAMARALSTMLAFDYVTGNWDRFSGGNIARDGTTGRLLYVDNDGAFYEQPPLQYLARQLSLLRRVVRFSRSFVAALRGFDEPTLRDALGDDLGGEPLLPDAVLAAVEARRRTVTEVIDAQIARAGEEATLAFE